jgi:flagellar hook protein FlgE
VSIYASLYVAVSGMRSNQAAIGVIGNNIANQNTIGFKSSRAVFNDLVAQPIAGSAGVYQRGGGSGVQTIQKLMTAGSLLGTNIGTDLAISGDGFYVLEDGDGEQFYTRNGQFRIDADGYLAGLNGMRVLGYPAAPIGEIGRNGDLSTSLGPLLVGQPVSPPQATNGVAMAINLDSAAPFQTFNPADAAGTSSYSTRITVYDSLGTAHESDVYFSQTAAGEWTWNAFVPQDSLQNDGVQTPVAIADGTLSFDTDGRLESETQNASNVTFFGATQQTIRFDFGEETSTGGDGSGSTAFATPFSISFVEQDGYGVGSLYYYRVREDGSITGQYTNGRELLLGRLALARFTSPDGLYSRGGNLYSVQRDSGDPTFGKPQVGGMGDIVAGSLEQSNVDLSDEFTAMILAQRGFQASSRTVSTADEMLLEMLNLKR